MKPKSKIRKSMWVMALTVVSMWSIGMMATAQFLDGPSVRDNRGIDSVFSTDPDSPESTAVITFQTSGAAGDYRIIIDTNGAGGKIEGADGKFDINDDRVIKGGLGVLGGVVETTVVTWDGKDRNGKIVADGIYKMKVEIDHIPNGDIDAGASFTSEIEVTVDSVKPVVSATTTPFSPAVNSTTSISYVLSENVTDLAIDLISPVLSAPPKLNTGLRTGNVLHKTTWNGKDGIGTLLKDGVYTFKFTATDPGGNVGEATVDLIIDTKAPKLITITPTDNTITRDSIAEVSAQISDVGDAGIDYENSPPTLTLTGPNGTKLSGNLTRDETNGLLTLKLVSPISLPSQSGPYTATVTAFDTAGNKLEESTAFIYDSTPPVITSVVSSGNTLSTANANVILPQSGTVTITVEDKGGSGIEFNSVNVAISGPAQPLSFSYDYDELSTITAEYVGLSEEGNYTIDVTLSDRAGNVTSSKYPFRYVLAPEKLPGVIDISIADGSIIEGTTVRTITATLQDNSNTGIDLTKSSIQLLDSGGQPVIGTKTDDGANKIIWNLLKPLTANSGVDGVYRISVTPVDKSGNVGLTDESEFLFVSSISDLIRFAPEDGVYVNTLDSIVVQVDSTLAGWIDMKSSQMTVSSGSNEVKGAIKIEGDTITWSPLNPIRTDGTDDGKYDISLELDKSIVQKSSFYYDTQAPAVAVSPPAGSKVTSLGRIDITLTDDQSGFDPAATQVSLIKPDGSQLPFVKEITATGLSLVTPALATDGSEDGIYTLSVTPKDRAGNVGIEEQYRFSFVMKPSKAVSLSVADGVSVNEISTISAQILSDWVDPDKSTITVIDPNGQTVAGELTTNGELLWRIKTPRLRDGSQDGAYVVRVTLVDKIGNSSVVERTINYDSQAPKLVSLTPAEGEVLSGPVAIVAEVTDDPGNGVGSSGVDFAASTLTLIAPDGGSVAGKIINDAVSKITFTPDRIDRSGRYTINIQLVDNSGNSSTMISSYFEYEIPEADIVAIAPADESSVNTLTEVSVTVSDGTDVAETARNISLSGPKGTVATKQTIIGNVITATISRPLSTTGSDDGVYTLTVTPVDRYGNKGAQVTAEITYDTRLPKLESLSYVDDVLTSVKSIVNAKIERIEMTVSDVGSGIDFDASVIKLTRASDGQEIAGALGNDDSARIWLILDSPLKQDGTDDGEYSVSISVADKAGNTFAKSFTIIYDNLPPTVVGVKPESGSNLKEPISSISVELQDTGSGVDLDGTEVKLTGPSGDISANKSNDGKSIITLTFNALATDGSEDGFYRIQVKPTDKAGNSIDAPLIYEFGYFTQMPEVASITPVEYAFVNQLSSVSAVLEDYSGKGIDLAKSSIRLVSPSGTDVPGRIERTEPNKIALQLDKALPRDGSVDGQYVIETIIVDKAGNTNTDTAVFLFDTFTPQVTGIEGLEGIENALPEKIVLTFSDENPNAIKSDVLDENIPYAGSGVDLDAVAVELIGPGGKIPLDIKHNGVDTITATTLTDSVEEGTYTLQILPVDRAGNTLSSPIESKFSIVYTLPSVQGAQILSGMFSADLASHGINYVNSFPTVKAKITGSNVDPVATKIEVSSSAGRVLGFQEFLKDESSTTVTVIKWTPKLPIATDGSADGTYTITVTPTDNSGRTGDAVSFTVVYDTQLPRVTSISGIDLSSPINYLSNQISRLEIALADEGPAGLDKLALAETPVTVTNSSGVKIAGQITSDASSKVFWTPVKPFASDGTMDDTYDITIKLTDKARNSTEEIYSFVYDTVAPKIEFMEPKAELVTGALTRVVVRITDPAPGSVDFDESSVKLIGPDGNEISAEMNSDGVSLITLTFANPDKEGTYTISVMAVDRAGNGMGIVQTREFNYSTGLPVVIATEPATENPEEAYANQALTSVSAQLQESNNGGISFLSQIRLRDPNGNIVPGSQSDNGKDTIVWELAKPLPTDGSADGKYTITVIPINASGRRGDQVNYEFIYDTVPPEVDTDTIQLVTSQTAENSLSEISVQVADDEPGSGIDWDNVDESWLKLIGPDGKTRSGKVTSDRNSKLTLKLDVPLATDGSQDGTYRVVITPKDKASNVADPVEYEFVYDTKPPVIDPTSILINDQPLVLDPNSPDYPTAINTLSGVTLQAKMSDEGVGVDLSKSQIQLIAPNGEVVSGSVKHNGVDTIEFKSDLLHQEGMYKVMIRGVGLDAEELGIAPSSSISTSFLFELGKPTAQLVSHGTRGEYDNEPAPLEGVASDPSVNNVPASGVALVEVGGYGPDGKLIEWTPAVDESTDRESAWAKWTLDFLPPKTGKYDVKIRVTDRAGNQEIYDAGELEFTVSLGFIGDVYCWPNPINISKGDVGHFSFDVNLPFGETADVVLKIFDVAGDLVYRSTPYKVERGRNYDEIVTWQCQNQHGKKVAAGVYIFTIEADDGNNKTYSAGRILVVR